MNAPRTLVDMLRARAQQHPESIACLYLGEGEEVKAQLTFGELDQQARATAARLQGLGAAGESAVLLFPPGLEFVSALFGCLYANVVAVPLPVPRMHGSVAQLVGIVRDLNARVLMTTSSTHGRLARMNIPGFDDMVCLASEDTASALARAWQPAGAPADAVAYLQYTSGSTANRKGVTLRHEHVIANLLAIADRFRHHDRSVCVNWLPHTHDLGLVAGILQPLFHGQLNVLMSPAGFVQHPIRWLNAISRYRGTYSCSPNFGYDLCVRRTTPEQRAALDLSSWEVALNGAEPVRQHTLEEFVHLFAPCGFRATALYPAYGLAEATLVVSGGLKDAASIGVNLDAGALERNRVVKAAPGAPGRPLVGCGHALAGTTIAIVDPETCRARGDSEIGEIWVRGPSVAAGYWKRPDETARDFDARTDSGDGPYLRTGDLGFLDRGELYITGRHKDLIIIRGANHYPQDVELTVERSHPAFRAGCGAAFSVEVDDQEQLVVVFELERECLRDGALHEELANVVRRRVSEEHDLHVHALVLLKTGGVPRTTSGKIQRRQCREEFLSGELDAVWTSTRAAGPAPDVSTSSAAPVLTQPHTAAAADVVEWLREYTEDRVNSRLMDERRSIAPHVVLDFGNRGILGLQVPRELGGQGFGHCDSLAVIEQLGAIDQTLAMMVIVQNSLGIWPILNHAQPDLRSELLPRLASGRELAAFAMTEPAAGSNPQAVVSTATPDGADAWRLLGQKSWSGTAGWASVINVFAQNVTADGSVRGISGFVVPRGTKGLRMGPEALTLGVRGMVQNTIYLEGARVTRAQSLGETGQGMKVAHDGMMQGRLALGASSVGGIKRCLQLLVRYARRRTVSTGRLLDNPVLLERIGTLSAALAGIEALVHHVADRLDRGGEVPAEVFVVCKTAGSEWLWRAADDLVQFLGGRGYIETNVATQLLRDARVTRILEGPTEALGMFLGSRVLSDGAAFHGFLKDELGAPAVSARLADVASEIHARCTSGDFPLGASPADARRWACALIGQVATDALLLAATPRQAAAHCVPWAQQRFEASVASALARTGANTFRLHGSDVEALVDGFRSSIGDVDQSLAGEDHAFDDMLKRSGEAPAKVALPRPVAAAPSPAEAPAAIAAEPRTAQYRDPAAIEQFIVTRLARELKIDERTIDSRRSFFDYGLDSVTTVMLSASLEEWLGVNLHPEAAYDVPVIRQFARYVADRQSADGAMQGVATAGAAAAQAGMAGRSE